MHNRKYCCYRHFTEGKHEPSCTHCLTHVQLGVINPPHSPGKTPNNRQVPPLNITSTQFRIENRTHDYNEVQNKDSLPDRLKQPRLYVEKVLEKGKRESFVLPGKKSGSVEYEMLVKLYRKIGQCLKQKSKRSLLDLIRGHCIEHRYIRSSKQPIFLTKSQFVQMIVACFNKFSHTEAEQFWQIGYNELRFKQKLSVEAFVYNFDKFYIQLLNYNNTFSQAALRQRMIDLRVALFDWAQNQVCLKYNIKIIKDDIMDIEDMLKLSQDQELYFDFHSAVENCRLAHIKLRYLAEILFNLTDTKFLTLKKLKSSLHNKIEQRSRRLATSRQVLHNFFQTQDLLPTDKFAITDILQYCKTENSSQQVIADMISWIQGVFDFMFFYENDYDNEELGLGLNFTTRRLQCQKILEIDAQVVQNFDRFLERIFDMQIDVCRNLIAVVEGAMDKMPLLQGHKKEIVECNYLSETVLRFIRQISLKPFWWIVRITTQCRYQKQLKRISQILKTDPTEEEVKKNMKGLFTLSAPPLQINDKSSLKSNISEKDEVQYSLKKFERIKQEQLILKLKMPQIEEQKNKKEEYGEIQNLLRMEENREKKLDENCEVCGENHVEKCKQIVEKDKDEKGIGGFICCGSKYWHEASKQTNSTIASIEDMQSRLFNLLNLSI